jgi:tRNA (guanine10-N2)-dimethyltransferase
VRLLVELTLENEALARAEALAAREALRGSSRSRSLGVGPGMIVIDANASLARALAARLGLARRVSRLVAAGSPEEVAQAAARVRVAGSFAVRPRFLTPGGDAAALDALVRRAGDAVRKSNPDARVDLESPDVELPLLASGGMRWLCVGLADVPRSEVRSRDPRRRGLDRPIGIPAKFARAMANLARVRRGGVLLDPFCGSGGILLEGALIGARPVGIDIDPDLLEIASRTLSRLAPRSGPRLIEGDSESAPALLRRAGVRKVDAVVADLPYGRSSLVAGRSKRGIARVLASAATALLAPGARAVASTDSPEALEPEMSSAFDLEERFSLYVHKSLTRHILVMRRS